MKPILSGQKRTLACLALCLAGAPADVLRAQGDLALTISLAKLPELPATPSELEQALTEEARHIEEDRLRRLRFFEAIAANDKSALRKMLNAGMDPNAELPFPVPVEFQRRFSDALLRICLRRGGLHRPDACNRTG